MTASQDLKEILVKMGRRDISVSEGARLTVDILRELDTQKHKDRIDWLNKELDGYDAGEFPPNYAPPARKNTGEKYAPGDRLPDIVVNYRSQTVFLKKNGIFGPKEKPARKDNLMPVGEIERWMQELTDETTANMGRDRGWEITSPQICFIETWNKIRSRIDDLVHDVLDELPNDPPLFIIADS